MSRSIHITGKNFKGLSKKAIDEQADDPNSELRQWGRKSLLKDEVKKERKQKKKRP
jgi:TfoX/Sxy family transcriptional regulator of competence genes